MRFRHSHLQRTIFERVRVGMDDLGWFTQPVNFGTQPITFIEGGGFESQPPEALIPNSLFVTLPDEAAEEPQEMGGGLYAVRYTLHVDCYGDTGMMAHRILEDVKHLLHEQVFPVVNWDTETGVQTDEQVEVEVVAIESPGRTVASEARRRWRVLSGWAVAEFVGE